MNKKSKDFKQNKQNYKNKYLRNKNKSENLKVLNQEAKQVKRCKDLKKNTPKNMRSSPIKKRMRTLKKLQKILYYYSLFVLINSKKLGK